MGCTLGANHYIHCNEPIRVFGPLLEQIPANVLDAIKDSIQVKRLESGQVLFLEDQEIGGIHAVFQGSLKLVKNVGKSNEQIVLLSAPGEMMGITSVFNGEKYQYTAVAMESSQICFLPRKLVVKLIEANPQVLLILMRKVNKAIEEIENRTTLVMANDSETIVLKTIHELKGKFGTDQEGLIRIQMPVKDLANYLCMSKTNLYRVLNNLRKRFILQYDIDRYRLIDQHYRPRAY